MRASLKNLLKAYSKQLLCVCILLFFTPERLHAQQMGSFFLNTENGLPTNFIYDILIDHYGYMWLATPKGVVKYDGYQSTIFDQSAGLPNEDIWTLYEDKKGRIWCGSHANRIGYIANNTFTLIENKGFNETLYPRVIASFDSSICFSERNNFYYVQNDTLHRTSLTGALPIHTLNNLWGDFYCFFDSTVKVRRCINGQLTTVSAFDAKQFIKKTEHTGVRSKIYHSDMITHKVGSDTFWVGNKDTFYSWHHPTLASGIISIFNKKNSLYINTPDQSIELDTLYHIKNIIKYTYGKNGNNTPIASKDVFWGQYFGTNNRGLELTFKEEPGLHFSQLNLPSSIQYITNLYDSISVWKNVNSDSLYLIESDQKYTALYTSGKRVNNVLPYSKDSLILITAEDFAYWLDTKSRKLERIYPKGFSAGYSYAGAMNQRKKVFLVLNSPYAILVDIKSPSNISTNIVDSERYVNTFYDSYYDFFAAYRYDKVIILKNGKKYAINQLQLSLMGISNIESITSDNRGYLYIKDIKQIHRINLAKSSHTTIPTYAIFTNARMTFDNNQLVVASKSGLFFYKVYGAGLLYTSIPNSKNNIYKNAYSFSLQGNTIFINTDKGQYFLKKPEANDYTDKLANPAKYHLYCKSKKEAIRNDSHDTLKILQESPAVSLELINPSGVGKVSYLYKISRQKNFTEAAGNEIYLDMLPPGKATSVEIIAKDEIWKSPVNKFYVLLAPKWWQTKLGQLLLFFSIAIFFLLFTLGIYIVIKRMLTRRTEQKQLQMDIELKAIYSQINPHFIFNTLSGTQYFIRENKNESARLHLNKFSRLLRSYIQSSRNKYISIQDEVENLRNYIELQQIRFADKFDYEITIDDKIITATTFIPSLLLQPIVENAINHGIFHLEREKGLLQIQFLKNGDRQLQCIVDDNGVGRKKAREIKENSIIKTKSFGSDLTRDLINIFNKYEKLKIAIEYIDKKSPYSGTTVIIGIENPMFQLIEE